MYEHIAYRFCPKCGQSWTFTEPERLRCNACSFSFYTAPKPAVSVLFFNEQGEVCFSRRAIEPEKGLLDTVGGFVDRDESIEACAVRETHEEVDLTLTEDRLIYLGSATHDYLYHGVDYKICCVFVGTTLSLDEQQQLTAADDVAELVWLSPDAVQQEDFAFPPIFAYLQANNFFLK